MKPDVEVRDLLGPPCGNQATEFSAWADVDPLSLTGAAPRSGDGKSAGLSRARATCSSDKAFDGPVIDSMAVLAPVAFDRSIWLSSHLQFIDENGRLLPRSRDGRQSWLLAVRHAAQSRNAHIVNVRDRHGQLPVVLRPLTGGGSIEVVVGRRQAFFEDSLLLYARHAGLTQAETQVLLMILRGNTPKQVAGLRSARESTIRTQIRAILGKTGFSCQLQLALFAARLPRLEPMRAGSAGRARPPAGAAQALPLGGLVSPAEAASSRRLPPS